LIIVDDGSSDASLGCARDWLTSHRNVAGMVLRHPVNRGLAHTRNDALAFARGEFCFILDADNEVYPGCLERLYNALQNDPEAAFAYGIHERFRGEQTVGLVNHLPWEPDRLRTGNYIDAMAMLRTSVLREMGGYATDRRLHGWEDYDLWCSVAEAGMRGAFIPEIIARYRTAAHSMLALTNVSATDAYSIIIERCPTLMAGVEPPY
jgi:glycosyltransferase involved in cell wall biosynthesis